MKSYGSGSAVCPVCGKRLYDNGETRFTCPFCGSAVSSSGADNEHVREETLAERCRRLEREAERLKVKAGIESLAAEDHFLSRGSLFSMIQRHAARKALDRGDIEAAKRHLKKAEVAHSVGCLIKIIAVVLFVILGATLRRSAKQHRGDGIVYPLYPYSH